MIKANIQIALMALIFTLLSVFTIYVEMGGFSIRNFYNIIIQSPFNILMMVVSIYLILLTILLMFRSDLFKLKSEKSVYEPSMATKNMEVQIKYLQDQIDNIISLKNSNIEHIVLSEKDMKDAKDAAVNNVISKLTSETIDEIALKAHVLAAENIEIKSLQRLSNVGEVLGLRANKTLLTGVGFCTLGLIFIFFSFIMAPSIDTLPDSNQWTTLLINYAPRFTLVVIVELIGFFFLKLYKSTLSDIRYTQNEITNIEMKLMAIHSSGTIKEEYADLLLKPLIETERNSIIEKSQTTVEIEQQGAQSEADKSTIEAAVALLHGNEKGSIWRRGS